MPTDETRLAAVVTLGKFLLKHYDRDRELDLPAFLADFKDLCRRFTVDFDAVLEEAESLWEVQDIGTGSRSYVVNLSHVVQFTDDLLVRADTEDEAVALAKEHFRPRWGQATLTDVVVNQVTDEG